MRKVYTWAAVPAQRNLTVADLREGKKQERIRALKEFRQEAMDGKFPEDTQIASIDPEEFEGFECKLNAMLKTRQI